VASLKALELVTLLLPHFEVRVVATAKAVMFIPELATLRALAPVVLDEDDAAWSRGDPVLHI
jgi:hypothetical protein